MTAAAGAAEPHADGPRRRLIALLVALTVVSGLVDAVSFLRLGHVFVANMTGNVVFLALSVGDPNVVDWRSSLAALVSFVLGARVFALAFRGEAAVLLGRVSGVEALFFAVVAVCAAVGVPVPVLIVVLSFTMGMQSAVAQRLAVAGFSTTVLTMTLVGLGVGQRGARHRLVAVLAMFAGAGFGAFLVVWSGIATTLAVTALVAAGVAVCARFVP